MAKSSRSAIYHSIDKHSFKDFSVNELMCFAKKTEIDLHKKFEHCSVNYFEKVFKFLDLKKDFLSYEKSLKGIDKKELCVCFMKNYISELLSNLNSWSSIFKTEEEDKVNRKHRKNRKNFMQYLSKLREINHIFHFSLKVSKDKHSAYLSKKNYYFA